MQNHRPPSRRTKTPSPNRISRLPGAHRRNWLDKHSRPPAGSGPECPPGRITRIAHVAAGKENAMQPPTPTALPRAAPIDLIAKRKVEGLRLDQYLVEMFPDLSRSALQKVIDAGGVLVNGNASKASYKVRHGDQIRVWPPEPSHELPVAEDIPL